MKIIFWILESNVKENLKRTCYSNKVKVPKWAVPGKNGKILLEGSFTPLSSGNSSKSLVCQNKSLQTELEVYIDLSFISINQSIGIYISQIESQFYISLEGHLKYVATVQTWRSKNLLYLL